MVRADENYNFKRQIIIKNNFAGKIPKGFTINLSLNTEEIINNGKINSDCSDLRIFDSNKNEKDRIIKNCGKNNTIIYFKLDEDIDYINDKYYLYYGNKNSSRPFENKSNVYYFFDDFEKYYINQNPPFDSWYSNGGNWKIDNTKSYSGEKSLFEDGYYVDWKIINNTLVNVENFTYISYGMIGKEVNVWSFGIGFNIQNESGYRYQAHWEYHIGSGIGGWTFQLRKVLKDPYEHYSLGSVYPFNYSALNITPPQINKWYEFKVIRLYPNIKVFFNENLIFNVNDSTFKNGSIGFLRYSNLQDSSRKSWYDDPTVMLYVDPWPNIYLCPEEENTPLNISLYIPKNFYIKTNKKIFLNVFQKNEPIINLTIDDLIIKIHNSTIEKSSFKNYKNGTYSVEIRIDTEFLGKKQIIVSTPYGETQDYIFLLVSPKKDSIIVTNSEWKNFVTAVSTNKTVLITNSSNLIETHKPKQIFFIDSNTETQIEHYYLDRDTLALIFFKNKEIIKTNDRNTAIKASSLQMPIIINPSAEILELLDPKNIYNFSDPIQVENFYLSKFKITNYIILANQDSEKSIISTSLAFKHNGFVILFSGNADHGKQKLKEKIDFSKYKMTIDYKFKNKVFLALVDVPYFLLDDPVNDSLIDFDGEKIKTDVPYADLNNDGYLDLSFSRLEGSFEAMTHQIYAEPKMNKQALVVSVYDTPQILDLFYTVPLMQYSQSLRGCLSAHSYNITSLVEKRSYRDQYYYEDVKNITKNIKSYIEDNNLDSLFKQIRHIFSTFNEAVYLLVEFDWSHAINKLINDKTFVLKHFPIYTKENLLSNIADKDIIIYMAFGNKTHFFVPNYENVAISDLPNITSFIYLYYTNSYQTLNELQNKKSISILASTASSYTPQSSYSSYLMLKNFNGEVAYFLTNGKNELYKYYKAIKNISLFSSEPYLKDYYSKTLYSDPAKIFDPYLDLKQSDSIYSNGESFYTKISIKPNYTIINNDNKKIAYFKEADYIDGIPFYKKTLILPGNAIIKNVSFSSDKIQENVSNFQLSRNFWYDTFKLLDNRTVLEIIIIPVTNFDEILTNINVDIFYEASMEITNIYAKNFVLYFDIYSSRKTTATAKILIETEKEIYLLNKSIIIDEGINNYVFDLPKNGYGLYSIGLIIEDEEIVGPKYTYFYFEPLELIKNPLKSLKFLNFMKFFESETSFKSSLNVYNKNGNKIIEYKTYDKKLLVEINSEYLQAELNMFDKKLLVRENSKEKIYEFISSNKKAVIHISSGLTEETYTHPDALKELKEMLSIYNEIVLKIQEQYT
ncbi:MAG: DUF2341 domain-containing protein [Candidatus Aenigmatarchaeota archaeon]